MFCMPAIPLIKILETPQVKQNVDMSKQPLNYPGVVGIMECDGGLCHNLVYFYFALLGMKITERRYVKTTPQLSRSRW